jgi:hypothetical protein
VNSVELAKGNATMHDLSANFVRTLGWTATMVTLVITARKLIRFSFPISPQEILTTVFRFDPASLVMIDKLNQIIRNLTALQPQHRDVAVPGLQSTYDLAFHNSAHLPTALGSSESPLSQTHSYAKARHGDVEDFMEIPSFRTTADAILLWPIFDGKYPPEYLVDVLFESRSRDTDDECGIEQDMITFNRPKVPVSRPSYREDEVLDLVEQFLSHVHIKNPILDVETLRNYARRLVEEGPAWDGATCLVVRTLCLRKTILQITNNLR